VTFTCRFTWERALRESDLTATQRLICYTIATWADLHTGVIPEKWTPSISRIAKAAGLDPSTVKRNLPRVVEAGWLAKTSPSLEAARTRHARNQYRLALPAAVAVPDDGVDRAGRTVHQARDTTAEAGRTGHPSWAHSAPSQGAQDTQAGRTAHHSKSLSPKGLSKSDARAAVAEELAAATGRQIDDEWAEKVAKQILGAASGDVASPVAYVTTAIRRAADDGTVNRFLPTPVPNRFDVGDLEVLPPRPDPVMETAECGHLRVAGDAEECWLCAQEAADAAAGDAPQQPAAADSDHAAEPPAPARPALTVHPGGNRPPRRGRNQPPLLTAVDDTPDDTPDTPGLPPELAERLARHRAGFAGRTRPTGATA